MRRTQIPYVHLRTNFGREAYCSAVKAIISVDSIYASSVFDVHSGIWTNANIDSRQLQNYLVQHKGKE